MKISLKEFGGFLNSKELGHRIAYSILDSIRRHPDNNVILDFSSVHSIHRNFCEELLKTVLSGIGFEEFKKRVMVQNMAAVVKIVFDSVLARQKDTQAKGIDDLLGSPIQTVYSEKKESKIKDNIEEEPEKIQVEDERSPKAVREGVEKGDNEITVKTTEKRPRQTSARTTRVTKKIASKRTVTRKDKI